MTREDISDVEKMTELRLDASNPLSKGKIFVLVEGDDDCKIFKRLLASHCKVETFSGGVEKLQECVQILVGDSNFRGLIIGIRDADFLYLEGKTSSLPELFLTDFHDLEMMMVYADETFESIMAEFGGKETENPLKLRNDILTVLQFVSYLRWWNDQNNAELKFKAVSYGGVFEGNTLKMDVEKYLMKLISVSPNAIEKDTNLLTLHAKSLEKPTHDLYQLCNGHDFMKILSLYINGKRTQDHINDIRLSAHFRTAYSKPAFYKTQLYANLQKWASENHTTI